MVSEYYPDGWVIFKTPKGHKVFGCWQGSFAQGDAWRMNSGITEIQENGELYLVHGESGSIYILDKEGEGRLSLYCFGLIPNEIEIVAMDEIIEEYSRKTLGEQRDE